MAGVQPTPASLSINAWTGTVAPSGAVTSKSLVWGLQRHTAGPSKAQRKQLGPAETDERDWRDAAVGWGVVLPDNPKLTPAQLATADDAPDPIRKLVASRQPAPVLRYSATEGDASVVRYYTNGSRKPFSLVGSKPGVADDAVPRYLLLYGGPDAIPWSFQYALNLTHHAGRLSLAGTALERYVNALIDDWAGMPSDPRAPVVWSVSHGHPDITWLMDAAISRKVFASYDSDKDGDLSRRTALFDVEATADRLASTLAARSPSLVVTTSHGMTGPLNDPAKLAAQLGFLVDVDKKLVQPQQVLDVWRPNGAIWYSHACCSAGSDSNSCYAELLDSGSEVTAVLAGVAAASGNRVAPFPEAMLGDERPLRAFVGHVEPTFDYTLRDPATGQPLTHTLRAALYEKLYAQTSRAPVGWALAQVFDDAGAMFGLWSQSVARANQGKSAMRATALYQQLTALDRQHTVILGDPTVSLPPLASTPK